MSVLKKLQPENVLHYFEEISAIPHGSGNTKAISDYCVHFAEERGLEHWQDEAYNVVIKKPATAGYEEAPVVILQGHLGSVWLDGQQVGVVNTYSDVQTSSVRLWELTGLEAGVHEVRLVNLGETDGTGIWLEIDKAIVTGVESENMIIHALNNAFVTSNAKYVEQSPIGYYEMTAGEKATIRVRGSRLTLLTASGTQGTVSVSVNQNAAQLITLGASALLALLILWQARRILHNANNGTVFSLSTVRSMRILGVEVLVGSLFYVVMLFCGMTKFAIGLLALVFALAGMIVLVFAELFVQAINYKQENDMTI